MKLLAHTVQLKRAQFDSLEKKLKLKHRNSYDRLCWIEDNGERLAFTRRSHGSGDLPAANQIRQGLKLNEDQFRELLACSMSRDEYIKHLREKKAP